MAKKLFSIFLSLIILVTCLYPAAVSVEAATYKDSLRKKGFPESYISYIYDLHKKYPKWKFVAYKTGLDWETAVKGERSSHSKQQLNKKYKSIYYCHCSKCTRNGKPITHSYGLYNASEGAVKYFMDPRNWMDSKHIFQFESSAYNKSQTVSGVEAILKGTWMHNSVIEYLDTEGNKKTCKIKGKPVKYSTAIINAAKAHGVSAYYIASKIKQEVGATTPKAGGVCGTRTPFKGFYNYYSIGANSGAMDGLEWASGFLKTNKKTTLYSSYNKTKKIGTGKKTTVKKGHRMSFIKRYGDYYKVRLYRGSYKSGSVGYIKISDIRTKYLNYGRPWTSPYKSIYYGAKYIKDSYLKLQKTSYLQKFNVNKEHKGLYGHEYLVNVNGPAQASVSTYNAYKSAGILSKEHTFYIPVFKHMPKKACKAADYASAMTFKAKSTRTTITLNWKKVSKADGYKLYKYNPKTKKYEFYKKLASNSTLKYKVEGLKPGTGHKFGIKYYYKSGSKTKNSAITTVQLPTKPNCPEIREPVTNSKHHIITRWRTVSPCTGYIVQYSKRKDFSTIVATRQVSSSTRTQYTGKNLVKGRKYYVRVRAYRDFCKKRAYSKWSEGKGIVCK